MREDDEKEQAENANNQTASNGGQTESNPESPSWRFWM
jgi:hypothetical protein